MKQRISKQYQLETFDSDETKKQLNYWENKHTNDDKEIQPVRSLNLFKHFDYKLNRIYAT